MSFRDSTIVIIETGRTVVRAGLGLGELLKTPSTEIQARVGLRRESVNGHDTTTLRVAGSSEDVCASVSASRASSVPPQAAPRVNDYLVGAQLDEALAAGQCIEVSWPFKDGDIGDYTQAEAIWKHVLFALLSIRRAQNESPVLLCLPPGISRASHERIAQIFFERFNVAGYTNLDRPIAQLYAANALSGVVVDIGYDTTDVTPIYDGFLCHGARTKTNVGMKDCQLYLANLLASNQSVSSISSSHSDLLALVQQIHDADLIRIPSSGEKALTREDEGITDIAAIVVAGREKAVIEQNAQKKRKMTAAEQARAREIEALDLVAVQFNGQEVTVGRERHRFCEPLFDPSLMDGIGMEKAEKPMSLQDAVGFAVGHTEVDQRQYIWSGLFVTGELANHVKGVGTALQSRCAPYILSNLDQQNEVQTRSIRPISVPEYFAEYRDRGDGLAAFLGSSIVAKIVFNDSHGKNFVSKADYTNKGPKTIIEMSPSLL